MLTVLVGAVFTLVGIVVGGAVRAAESAHARKKESEAVLSALVAEVEAVTRLINHRQFIPAMMQTQQAAQTMIAAGHGDQPADFIVISLKQNYYVTYDALLPKLGLIDPYWADRITRFYTYAKAVSENYDPTSPFQQSVTANVVDHVLTNDLLLLHTVVLLGTHIGNEARVITPPDGVVNPFGVGQPESNQPALPEPHPNLASASAADQGA